jgi:hypothetical protein
MIWIKCRRLRTTKVLSVTALRDGMPKFMLAAPFKWLLIGLIVVSFVGRPWAQALPLWPQGCSGSSVVAMQYTRFAMTHAVGKIAANEMAAPQHDSGDTKSADCVKSCAAVQVLGLAAMTWSPEVWPQIHSAAIAVVLSGHPPKPELTPPIVLA